MDLARMISQTPLNLEVDLARSKKIFAMAEDICRPLRVTNLELERLSNQIAEMARVRTQDIDRLRESVKWLCRPIEPHIHETILKKMLGGIH